MCWSVRDNALSQQLDNCCCCLWTLLQTWLGTNTVIALLAMLERSSSLQVGYRFWFTAASTLVPQSSCKPTSTTTIDRPISHSSLTAPYPASLLDLFPPRSAYFPDDRGSTGGLTLEDRHRLDDWPQPWPGLRQNHQPVRTIGDCLLVWLREESQPSNSCPARIRITSQPEH
jgi:hypothetical protein